MGIEIEKSGFGPSVDAEFNSIKVGEGTAAAPSIAIGEVDNGFYQAPADIIRYSINGIEVLYFGAGGIGRNTTGGVQISASNSSATVPVHVFNGDTNTGVGRAAADQLSLIAGGVEGIRLTENGGILQTHQTTAGITADTGSSQGDGALTSSFNEISVCANAGDAVTLPTAAAGQKVTIINNGANTCDVFPASSDNCGGGVDTAVSLAAGADITYFAYDATNYVALT